MYRVKKILSILLTILLPVLFGLFIAYSWENGGVHTLLNLRTYLLPVPSQIKAALFAEWSLYIDNSITTVGESLFGLVVGSLIGYMVAAVVSFFNKYGKGAILVATALNAVPLIAWMPIMNNWFGIGSASKAAVATICCIPAMAINCYRGMTELKPFAMDLLRTNAASKWQVFVHLRIPNSLPYVFTALKINTTTAVLAAVISETFSSYSGIGFQMSSMLKTLKLAQAWGYIFIASLIGIALYLIVILLEHFVVPWHESQRNKKR